MRIDNNFNDFDGWINHGMDDVDFSIEKFLINDSVPDLDSYVTGGAHESDQISLIKNGLKKNA